MPGSASRAAGTDGDGMRRRRERYGVGDEGIKWREKRDRRKIKQEEK
jgi:hypothetical protein